MPAPKIETLLHLVLAVSDVFFVQFVRKERKDLFHVDNAKLSFHKDSPVATDAAFSGNVRNYN